MESTKEPAIRVKGARKFQGSTASRKMKPNAATQQKRAPKKLSRERAVFQLQLKELEIRKHLV